MGGIENSDSHGGLHTKGKKVEVGAQGRKKRGYQ